MLNWSDRRLIGALFLASSGVNVATNPRRWNVLGGNVEISTPEGIAVFQQAILKSAQDSVAIHQYAGAQGMIQWDIEGQQIGDTYYGSPDMVGQIAPEMESLIDGIPLCDVYFNAFKDAGLKVGVCVRPQRVSLSGNYWIQTELSDNDAYLDLKNSIGYARDRWECTLFYIDSNADRPEIYKQLAADFPDVLLMPEHQIIDFYEFTAPFDSMHHHGVTRTDPSIRTHWTGSFSAIYAPGGTSINGDIPTPEVKAQRRSQMVNGMRQGDIYIFNGWYDNEGTTELISMFDESQTEEPLAPPFFQ